MKENDDSMEQRILECAEKLFLDKGFALTSTTEIAKEAGCNQALVHYYYRTKENLFQQIFENKLLLFIQPFTEEQDEKKDFIENIEQMLSILFDMMADNPKLPFMLINELLTNPSQVDSMKDKIINSCGNVFDKFDISVKREIAQGHICRTTALDITLNIISLTVSYFLILPVLQGVNLVSKENEKEFANKRKQNIIHTVINSLRP